MEGLGMILGTWSSAHELARCHHFLKVCGGSMSPQVYHLGSHSQILSLPVPEGVATQSAIFAKDRVS